MASLAVPCGELACQKDSMLRTLKTTVVSCTPRPAAAPEAGGKGGKKKGKKGGKEADAGEAAADPMAALLAGPLHDVVLVDTVLFPEGGGQPSDMGTVGAHVCVRVENRDGTAVHVVCAAGAEALQPGAEVDLQVDWDRRWDHMAQHSTQHLVTATASKLWGYETLSWNLGIDWTAGKRQPSFLELGVPDLAPEQLSELEQACNAAVRANNPVVPAWHSVADVNGGVVPGLRMSSRALPESVTGPVRVVSFEGIDTNTCCGTHVVSLAQLQAVKLLKVEKSGKAACKVHFVAGPRVLSLLGEEHSREQALGQKLSAGGDLLVARVDDLLARERAASKTMKALTAEVVALTAFGVLAQIKQGQGRQVVSAHRVLPPGGDAIEFMKGLAVAVCERDRQGEVDGTEVVLVVTVATGENIDPTAPLDDSGMFLVAGPPDMVSAVSPAVAEALQGRGGGRGDRYQGKCSAVSNKDSAVSAGCAAIL